MKIAYWGNFGPEHSTENDVRRSLEELGHEVVLIQEGEVRALDVPDHAAGVDLLIWTQTYALAEQGGTREERARTLDDLRAAGVPTLAFHLDRWWGLAREAQVLEEPFFRCDLVATADGGHEAEFAAAGINHVWAPPGVLGAECVPGVPMPSYRSDAAFVGSWRRYGHEEWWPARRAMLDALRHDLGARRFRTWPAARGAIRGLELNHLFASATVIVGDSCLVPSSDGSPCIRYWSDRVSETVGRGGFLVHPWVEGIDEHFEDGRHLRLYPLGDHRELVRLVRHYAAHPEEARAIAAEGQAHAREHHSYAARLGALVERVATFPGEVREGTTDAEVVREIYGEDVYRARQIVGAGSKVVDVGANVGVFSVWAAKRGAQVIAVEPLEENVAQLRRNLEMAGVSDRVEVLVVAVGFGEGSAEAVPGDGTSRSGGAWTRPGGQGVRQVGLDELVAVAGGRIDLLKVDCEGAEFALFAGASEEALEACEHLAIEYHGSPMVTRDVEAGAFGRMVERLSETHQLDAIGRPSQGGYVYARRLSS